jgi:hypothetical protein
MVDYTELAVKFVSSSFASSFAGKQSVQVRPNSFKVHEVEYVLFPDLDA